MMVACTPAPALLIAAASACRLLPVDLMVKLFDPTVSLNEELALMFCVAGFVTVGKPLALNAFVEYPVFVTWTVYVPGRALAEVVA